MMLNISRWSLVTKRVDDENINVRHNSSLTHCSIGSKFLLSDFELLFSYVVYVSGTISKSDSKNLLPQ